MSESGLPQQAASMRVSYDADDLNPPRQRMEKSCKVGGSALLGRKHAPDRRPLRFWQPFNDWWRSELEQLGRRPNSQEIDQWYARSADDVWGDAKPTLQETRVHAKCLRSLPLVRDYFRNYRAKKRGSKAAGTDGDENGDTDGGDDSACRPDEQASKHARHEDVSLHAAMPTMVQIGPEEMMQMQASFAAGIGSSHLWGEAVGGMEGQDTDDYTRALMMQQHLQAAMLQQQMAVAAVAARQFSQQHLDVLGAQDDDDEDDDESDPGENDAAAYEHTVAGEGASYGLVNMFPVLPSGQMMTNRTPGVGAAAGQSMLNSMQPLAPAPHQDSPSAAAAIRQTPDASATQEPAVGVGNSMVLSQHNPAPDAQMEIYAPSPVQLYDKQQMLADHIWSAQPAAYEQCRQPGHAAADYTTGAIAVTQHDATVHMSMTASDMKASPVQQQQPMISKHVDSVALGGISSIPASSTVPAADPVCPLDGRVTVCSSEAADATASLLHVAERDMSRMQQDQGVFVTHADKPTAVTAATCPPEPHQNQPFLQTEDIIVEQPVLSAAVRLQPEVQQSHQEVVLLPAEQLLGMEQHMLVAHIKVLQEELYAKREILKRSFEQLRRTQERLGRRDRKLAKEQHKCRQYQQALTAWQASLVPVSDPAMHQLYQTQLQMAMTSQAAAAASQLVTAGDVHAVQQP